MLRKRIEETNAKISQLMQTALISKEEGQVAASSEAQANMDHLMRATNHLKLAQAEFE